MKSSYITPDQCPVRTVGKRKELLHQYVYDMVSKEVQEEIDTPTTTVEYTSVTKTDFTKGNVMIIIIIIIILFVVRFCSFRNTTNNSKNIIIINN